MKTNFISLGATCAALGIGLGAFGAHALHGRIAEAQLGIWETATRYWFVGSLGMVLVGVWSAKDEHAPPSVWAGWLLLAGSVLFSGSLFALALGAPRILGAVTPLGGLGLIAGFSSFAWAARAR